MPKVDVTFIVEDGQDPVAKARPRWSHGRVYTPSRTVNAENMIRKAWKNAGGEMIHGPVAVSIDFLMQTPKSWSQAKKIMAQDREILPLKKPDIDNMIKTVLDALNGLAYDDDKQIVELTASKSYNTYPGTCIRVREI